MGDTIRAAVLIGPRQLEIREFNRPALESTWGWLRVEACGLCGTDAEQYEGSFTGSAWPPGPLIPGHEIVGVLEEVPEAAARSGFRHGDRVVIEPNIPCGACRPCLTGAYVACAGWPVRPFSYGFVPLAEAPGLFGGWSEGVVLHPNTVVHAVPSGVGAGEASVFNALATAMEWAVLVPSLRPGSSLLVTGAGQRGLACVVAAREAGAGTIIVSGTGLDRQRLQHALDLGADTVVDVEQESLVDVVAGSTGGVGVDVVVDTSAGAVQPVEDALLCVRDAGTIVLAGLKGGRRAALDVDRAVLGAVRLQGVRSAGWQAYEMALRTLSRDTRLAALRTHVVPLTEAARAAEALAHAGPERVYVSIEP